ncbi:MAG: hypothetical protein ACR2KV_06380 [Solirubrobacteraceae bacterium]
MTQIRTACTTAAVLAAAALAATGAQARPSARGSSCANPWRVAYGHGRVTGDTARISLQVSIGGNQVSVSWQARPHNHFCGITLVEGRGSIFRSTNPHASYRYTDFTHNHTNGIRTLTATARTGA